MNPNESIAAVSSVPTTTTLVFTITDRASGEDCEAILIRTPEGIRCWLNYCQHLIHIRLDTGSGATVRGSELVCTNHGAMFETTTGYCTHGPCKGAYLPRVDIAVHQGTVILVDDRFTFKNHGPATTETGDLSSTTNTEF